MGGKNSQEKRVDKGKARDYNIPRQLTRGLLAQLVEHIVHIDGVTGSSPVQTTTREA